MSDTRPAISDVREDDLVLWLAARGQPSYRAKQIRRRFAKTAAASWDDLTELPVALRAELAKAFRWSAVSTVTEEASADGETRKVLRALIDGQRIESVLMPHHGARNAVCISTQAGCPMACAFCATGEMGLIRNLTAGEIVDQVRHWQRELGARGERVSHVVYMGMGEPFNNYGPTIASARALMDAELFGISPRRITISTCGVVPKIDELANEGLPINLAVSLHAADDRTRGAIMPINRKWGIDEVLDASARYVERTRRRVTFEYVLLAGVNDSERDARTLASRIASRGRTSDYHVNLIPVNAGPGGFERPKAEAMEVFAEVLREGGIAATVRISKGQDILAGCGQLKVPEGDAAPAGKV
ncbi:MAG: 23S rRNA (adenine(2503)-C(2))-methyltransferase RlmN [Chloroflexi bacterium]|nr:23S rRNA (adenine(2503)-C(2))-methyltransferase RlmN [Chloroflexota bacterium]